MLPQGTLSEGNVPFTFAEVTRQALYAGMLCYTIVNDNNNFT